MMFISYYSLLLILGTSVQKALCRMQMKQPYVMIPPGPEGKPLLRAHLHKQAKLALLNLIASKQTEHIDEFEKVRFSDCTFNANTAEEYAECMLPYIIQNIPQSNTKIKSSAKSQNVTTVASINETWIGSFKLKRRFPRQVTLASKQLQQMEAMNRFAVKKFTEEAENHRLLKVLTSLTQKLSLHSPASEVLRSVKEKMNISDTKIISEPERRQKLIRLTKRLLSGNINDDSESELFGWNYLRKAITDTEKLITNAVTNGNPLTLPKWQYDMMQLVKGMIVSTLKDNSTESPPTRLLSPRILSITPYQRDMINLLSPDLFSLFENDDPNNLLPLPQLFQSMHKADQEVLIEMIMDVTGAGDILSLQDEIMPNQPRTLNKKGVQTFGKKFNPRSAQRYDQ
ncbi:Protein GrpE [Trichinella spiralis]|uniref:Protein GrpE n=1 Tax=Trichinella spiralis TaxID=6334 RepID=A0ABR3KW96_TRISP